MNGILNIAVAERISERLNRPVIVPVMYSNDFEPLNTNFHSMVNHSDLGTLLTTILDSVDVFVGRLWVKPAFSGIKKVSDVVFLHLDMEGNEKYSVNTSLPAKLSLSEGLVYDGVFAGVGVIDYFAGNSYSLKYDGYLLKKV